LVGSSIFHTREAVDDFFIRDIFITDNEAPRDRIDARGHRLDGQVSSTVSSETRQSLHQIDTVLGDGMKRPLTQRQLENQAVMQRLLQQLVRATEARCSSDLKDELGESRQRTNGLLNYLFRLNIVSLEPRYRGGSRRPLHYYRLAVSEAEAQQRLEQGLDPEFFDEERFVTPDDLAWMAKYQQQAQQRQHLRHTIKT
jgi:hypothetical protein